MVIEVSRFRLAPDTSDAAFLDAAEETQSGVLAHHPGFLGRELLRSDDGEWMDIVRFESADAARAAWAAFPNHPSSAAFERALDVSSVTMGHWSLTRDWPVRSRRE